MLSDKRCVTIIDPVPYIRGAICLAVSEFWNFGGLVSLKGSADCIQNYLHASPRAMLFYLMHFGRFNNVMEKGLLCTYIHSDRRVIFEDACNTVYDVQLQFKGVLVTIVGESKIDPDVINSTHYY